MSLCLDTKQQATAMIRRWGTAWQALESAEVIRSHHAAGSPQFNFWNSVMRHIRKVAARTARKAA